MHPSVILLIDLLVKDEPSATPFKTKDRNNSYQHFAERFVAEGVELRVSHFNNIQPDGSMFYWVASQRTWVMRSGHITEVTLAYAELPPHIPYSIVVRNLLSSYNIPVYNDLDLLDLATDKLRTYQYFPELIPYTVGVTNETLAAEVLRMRQMTDLHPDLDNRILFLKPRYGLWGEGIHVLHPDTQLPEIEGAYILQLFLESVHGVPELGINGRHDIRLMMYNGAVFQFKVKVPLVDTYVSNRAQRGDILYFELEQLPGHILDFGVATDKLLQQYSPRLYSMDVGIGASGKIWIYELNTMPGLAWNSKNPSGFDKIRQSHDVVLDMLLSVLPVERPAALLTTAIGVY